MFDTLSSAPVASPIPLVAFNRLVTVVSDASRWRMVRALASGEMLMVSELAEVARVSADSASKHMALMRETGIVTQGRNRLYQLRPEFIVDRSERVVDFGYCLLRLNTIP
jgi:DNA-binding transcriptional ArsR family regulator